MQVIATIDYLVFGINAYGKRYMKDLNKVTITDKPVSVPVDHEIKPSLDESFKMFLTGKEIDLSDLRMFLKMDFTQPFTRELANDRLIKEEYGSWLIRESSIKKKKNATDDILSCISISVKNKEKQAKENDNETPSIIHLEVFYAKGFGYYFPDTKDSTFPKPDMYGTRYLPLLGEQISFPEPLQVFTSFIDLLQYLKETETRMDLSKFIYLPHFGHVA